jgi:hypothetical protein
MLVFAVLALSVADAAIASEGYVTDVPQDSVTVMPTTHLIVLDAPRTRRRVIGWESVWMSGYRETLED